MKKIMTAAVALCMLGGVAFAQDATTTASSKHAEKKEAKATIHHHSAKAEKAASHHVAKKDVKAKHVKATKETSAKKEG